MIREMDNARHAIERGVILRALATEYTSSMTSVSSLLRALDLLGYSLTPENLEFHLVLLADRGYVQVWRARELPSWRGDRPHTGRADAVVFAHLRSQGLLLIDGQMSPDPLVAFGA